MNISEIFSRHLGFGVFIDIWSMLNLYPKPKLSTCFSANSLIHEHIAFYHPACTSPYHLPKEKKKSDLIRPDLVPNGIEESYERPHCLTLAKDEDFDL
jgi:hypothetical protein